MSPTPHIPRLPALLLTLLTALAAACSTTPAGPMRGQVNQDSKDIFYDVSGETAADLYQQMKAQGVRTPAGSFFGEYRWELHWNFRYEDPPLRACRMVEVNVELKARMVMPRWQPPSSAAPAVVMHWRRFEEALREHEQGHAALARHAAREVLETLRGLTTGDCSEMQAKADQAARAILGSIREDDARYDQETGHGLRQGAVWPPAAVESLRDA